jgi:hypothetical protein
MAGNLAAGGRSGVGSPRSTSAWSRSTSVCSQAFFAEAFRLLGGRVSARETGRFEITQVPAEVRDRDRQIGLEAPVLRRYERICFEREHLRAVGKPKADLVAPGHPLLDAVVDLVVEQYGTLLKPNAFSSTATIPARIRACSSPSPKRSTTGTPRAERSPSASTSSKFVPAGKPPRPVRRHTSTAERRTWTS